MSVHSMTVKQILSRVRQVFPDASENYVKINSVCFSGRNSR